MKKLKESSLNNMNMGMCSFVRGEDKISELSDPILHHILSFLPTKCVVSTSILSKRWRYLWTTIPVLDFRGWDSFDNDDYAEIFMNFMDRLMSLHDDDNMPSNIRKFYLSFYDCLDGLRVNAWISTVIRRNVEELILIIEGEWDLKLPFSLFTCESLTILELEMVEDCDYDLDLPESISFPNLKILRITRVTFDNENLAQLLFSSCPVLEELSLRNCYWWNINSLRFSAPALKRFFFSAPELEGVNAFKFEINAPNLLSFKYNEVVANDWVLHIFPLLVDADIDYIHGVNPKETRRLTEIGNCSTKLLEKLCNVKLLKMSGDTFEILSYSVVHITNLPAFSNLTHLEVSSTLQLSTVRTFFNFLQITPNLESLVFPQGCYDDESEYDDDDNDDDVLTQLNLVPQCFLQNLKSVEFCQFNGCPEELNVVKLVLTNAGVLQMMTILSASGLSKDSEKATEIKNQLRMFPRASTNCVVSFFSS